MKRFLFASLFLFVLPNLLAQDLNRVDASLELYPEHFEEASALADMIRRDFTDQEEQLRAVYGWIIRNIAYEPDEYKRFDYSFKNYRERNKKEEKTRQQIIRHTVSSGKAVCEGYAMLFEKLCNDLGIDNYLVRGDIKTHFKDIGRPFKRVHMWNIAILDGQPYLFDSTWGAGKYRDRFIREPSYFYYKAPPGIFVNTHFPAVEADNLLDGKVSREDFESWPLIIDQQLSMDHVIRPRMGILDSRSVNGAFQFKIRVEAGTRVSYDLGGKKRELEVEQEGETLSFSIPFKLGQSNLLIYFNDKPALAYKIK
jgi:hypothetical protein